MKKYELKAKTDTAVFDIKTALQIIYDALNHGQQKQIVKHEEVKTLFDRYGVEYEG